jgi:hypothetical protein
MRDKAARASHNVTIIAHHGVGAGNTVGGGLNRVQRFLGGWRADIALMGDNHQRAIMPTSSELSVEDGVLQSATRFIGRTGSFLRGYVDGLRSYVTDFALTPASLGIIEVELTLLKDRKSGKIKVQIRGIQ